jgi:hypothetical protein
LEIAFESGGGLPCGAGTGAVAGGGAGLAEPKEDVALVGEEVLGLAEVERGAEGVFEGGDGGGGLAGGEGGTAEEEVAADVLAEGLAFASFPGLEGAGGEEVAGLGGLAGLVVEGAEFDAEVVALCGEGGVFFEGAQA